MFRESNLKGRNKEFSIKSVSVILTTLLIFSSFLGLFIFENNNLETKATTFYVGGTGGGNLTTIQSAIDNASTGDSIYVYSGLYNETLIINKTLNLIGQDMNTTIINGPGSGNSSVIYIDANGVKISGFTVMNGGSNEETAGIALDEVKDCKIINNNISSNGNTGIYVSQSVNITIRNNRISANKWHGIRFYHSRNNSVVDNILLNNNIVISSSKYNSIENNEIIGPSKHEDMSGMNIYYVSEYNKISGNNISNWTGHGINIHYSNYNNITNNKIDSNGNKNTSQHSEHCGIDMYSSHKNTISGNSISKNSGFGITAYPAGNNLIIFNKIYDNPTGIWGSSNDIWNKIYLNEFINNTKNAGEFSSFNLWNSSLPLSYLYKGENYTSYLGNYWDDYSGIDSDSNGIGDTTYNITQKPVNKDYFPLMDPIDNYTLIPSTTKMKLFEDSSQTTNKTVSLLIQTARLDANITGTLNGTVNITELEIVQINSSYFAGFGFFRSTYRAVIEGKVYEGSWQGMLFNRSGERKFYLKGTVFGGLRGLTDGYLVEKVNGSGVYNLYNSTWTLNHLGHDLIFVQLNVNGTMDHKTSKNETTQIYILQSSFSGNATGYYNKSISVVITHIRITNKTSQYYGFGFSMITYVCAWGSGSGWTYDQPVSPNITKLTGFFTEPLWGLAFGKLDETGTKRILYFTLERIDIGLPPRVFLLIHIWGPWRVSPGQTINYFIEYRNIGLKSAVNTEIIIVLPNNTTYKSNTGGGVYNSTNHDVVWRFNISAKSKGHLSVKVKVNWGLSWGTKLFCNGSIRDFIQNKTLASGSFMTRVTPARDPNMKYGPEGNVTQGQSLDYKIEFENEGQGIAFGVYFTDELSEYLDDSTLEIGPVMSTSDGSIIASAGIYNQLTRTITWFVGEVGPGSGGYANISIKVRADTTAGSEILNYGTVYFPSVPETTRTNGIVSIVRDNQVPTAIISGNNVVNTFENIVFNGSDSSDPDGVITSYMWDLGDGKIAYGKVVEHYYMDDGDYTVTLTVKDDMGASDSRKISVRVLNRRPIAKLKVDSKDVKTKEVIFNAIGSSDMDGIVSEYYFEFGDGTNSGWVLTPVVSHIFADRSKEYGIELTVKDDDGATSANNVELKIIVNNRPIPKLAVDPLETYTYSDILCDGKLSTDPDGQISYYFFDFGDGNNSGWITTASIAHQYTDGTKKYAISLKVKDNYGTLSDEISINEILIKNRKPVPSLIVEDLDIYVLDEVVFDASGSYDPDGTELEYYFNFGDGTDSGWTTDPVVKHKYIKGPQDYSVELKVKDSDGEINTALLSLTVKNRVPNVDAGPDQDVFVDEAVNFDGSKSNDPDGNVLTFNWDFGDESTTGWLNSDITNHSYSQPGQYEVTLSVSDGTLTAEDTCYIQVKVVESKKDTDSDGDGVLDSIDAFPDDSAASVDSDGDKYPDFWNPGKSEADSTTGLRLDKFPNDASASVDSDGDDYPDFWNLGMSEDDSTTGLQLDDFPNDPNRHSEDSSSDRSSKDFYLMGVIIIFIIILIIGILSSIIVKNKNKSMHNNKPFDSDTLVRKVRDEVIQGDVAQEQESGISDHELWTDLKMKYQNGQISEETYKLLEQEKLEFESSLPEE